MRMDLPLCSFNYCRHYFDGNCIAKDGKREGCEFKALEDILYAPDGSERITLDRLRELVTAEVEGRAVVLPCKVGDTVYRIVPQYSTGSELLLIRPHGWKAIEAPFDLSMLPDISKTVFLTRAEAEAKGEQK